MVPSALLAVHLLIHHVQRHTRQLAQLVCCQQLCHCLQFHTFQHTLSFHRSFLGLFICLSLCSLMHLFGFECPPAFSSVYTFEELSTYDRQKSGMSWSVNNDKTACRHLTGIVGT